MVTYLRTCKWSLGRVVVVVAIFLHSSIDPVRSVRLAEASPVRCWGRSRGWRVQVGQVSKGGRVGEEECRVAGAEPQINWR